MAIAIDDYVLDTLMRDLTEHERSPAAFLVYLFLWRKTIGQGHRRVAMSYQGFADETGLSKSATQNAIRLLKRRRLVDSIASSPTATPEYKIRRLWKRNRSA
jgi:hypothetical protein